MDPILNEANRKIEEAIHHFKVEIAGIRAGRANPAFLENISVEAYGSRMKLTEIGIIAAPQSTLLTVQVWDNSLTNNVVKAIQEANLGLSPASDGNLIRLAIPPLTAERREEFIKILHERVEESRVEIRRTRQDIRNGWKKQQEAGEIGEDEFDRREKILQDLVDKSIEEVENLGKVKEEELSEI